MFEARDDRHIEDASLPPEDAIEDAIETWVFEYASTLNDIGATLLAASEAVEEASQKHVPLLVAALTPSLSNMARELDDLQCEFREQFDREHDGIAVMLQTIQGIRRRGVV